MLFLLVFMHVSITFEGVFLDACAWFIIWLYELKNNFIYKQLHHKYTEKDFAGNVLKICCFLLFSKSQGWLGP